MSHKISLLLMVVSCLGIPAALQAESAALLSGQVMVSPENPSWLVYNRDNDSDGRFDPFFLSAPGDPENFLYRGARNPDGTRSGDQLALINKLKGTAANAIYFQAIRSHGGDGSSDHNPFVDSDPRKQIDSDILSQWETWFTEMDNNGIVIFFFFYDDAIKVSSSLGWPLDASGNLHPQETYFIQTLVNSFQHHKHLIWVIMEEVQEMGSDYVQHAGKIAELVRQTDVHDHVIAVHKLSGLSFSEFADHPNIDQFAIQYNGQSAQGLHDGMVSAWSLSSGRYNLNLSEASGHYSSDAVQVRQKSWAAAMGGAYVMVLGMDIANTPLGHLQDAGRLAQFMESTDFDTMAPYDELAFAGTDYVLANPGVSYIAYAQNLAGNIGLKNLSSGTYRFFWYDINNGQSLIQDSVTVEAGNQSWPKPNTIGNELAVHIRLVSEEPPPIPQNLRFQ